MFKQGLSNSFKNAFKGVYHTIKSERNMKIHCVAALLTIVAAFLLQVTLSEWVALLIVICLVMATEMVNTAIEASVDLYTDKFHPLAKTAKDVAAGAVVICAITAVIIGLIIFLPYLI